MEENYFYPQAQSQQAPTEFIADTNMKMDTDLILKLISGHDILEELAWKMRGYMYNDANKEWIKIREKPFINELGVSDVLGLLNFILGKNTSLSGLEDWVIENIAEEFNIHVNMLLFMNGKKYEVEESHYSILAHLIATSAYVSLRRARVNDKESLGATLKFMKSTFVESHSYNSAKPEEKKGMFSGLLGRIR